MYDINSRISTSYVTTTAGYIENYYRDDNIIALKMKKLLCNLRANTVFFTDKMSGKRDKGWKA